MKWVKVVKSGALWGISCWCAPLVDKLMNAQPEETTEPTYYNSLYKHGVDEKRRVQIPAKCQARAWRTTQLQQAQRRDQRGRPRSTLLSQLGRTADALGGK